jgi:hypothetical protein
MANIFAPFGFADSHRLGAQPNYSQSRRWILATNNTPIFTGDPVVQLSTGYITQATPGTTQIAGIFVGCAYMSASQKKFIEVPYWPGSDAVVSGTGFDVAAKIIDDPQTVFRVQCGTSGAGAAPLNGNFTIAQLGNNANFAYSSPNGNTTTGKSTAYLDGNAVGVATTLPFRVVDLIRDPPGSQGADWLSAFNWVYVAFNFQDYKSQTGI